MKKLVFLDHDGGIDDILSLLLLLSIENIELIGVSVTPADCFIEPALESSYKILQLKKQENIELGRGEHFGVNAFPNEWRARPEIINALPMLINLPASPDIYAYPTAVDLIIKKLTEAPRAVSFILTGPCSNLVLALEKCPDLRSKVAEVVWMAGAFRVQGNVQTYQHNGTAEWNVYWDPICSRKLLEMRLPLVLVPLDVTNHVPVNKAFLSKLATQMAHPMSNLAGQLWALTLDTIPGYHYTYFMWDILATSYLAIAQEFSTEQVMANVAVRPPNAGQTYFDEAQGHPVSIATDINKEFFYAYLLERFRG